MSQSLKILVEYVDFHSDNYQGGSGKSFEFTTIIEVSADLKGHEIKALVIDRVNGLAQSRRPFLVKHDSNPVITRMEIL